MGVSLPMQSIRLHIAPQSKICVSGAALGHKKNLLPCENNTRHFLTFGALFAGASTARAMSLSSPFDAANAAA